jgi:hypothetical protein
LEKSPLLFNPAGQSLGLSEEWMLNRQEHEQRTNDQNWCQQKNGTPKRKIIEREVGPDLHQTVKGKIQKQAIKKKQAVSAETKNLKSSGAQDTKKSVARAENMKSQANHKNGGQWVRGLRVYKTIKNKNANGQKCGPSAVLKSQRWTMKVQKSRSYTDCKTEINTTVSRELPNRKNKEYQADREDQ